MNAERNDVTNDVATEALTSLNKSPEEPSVKRQVEQLCRLVDELNERFKKAKRSERSLGSAGPFGDVFNKGVIELTNVENALMPVVDSFQDFNSSELRHYLSVIKSLAYEIHSREYAKRKIEFICGTEILPRASTPSGPAQPTTENVCPIAVLATAPGYLQNTLLQANGCYEKGWYDACSVMIRKLIENLIIDVYEKHGKQSEIQQKDGNYLRLFALISALQGQSHWQLQRDTKKALPRIKTLGDWAAHNRRYEATRQDIDTLVPGLRVTVDELAHLAGHKRD